MKQILFILFATLCSGAEIGLFKYEGFQVIRAVVSTKEQMNALGSLQLEPHFDFWSDLAIGGNVDIMTPPELFPKLKDFLNEKEIPFKIWILDVEKLVREERESNFKSLAKLDGRMDWTTYHDYPQISDWLDSLTSHDHVTIEVIGQSFEGRDIKMAKISTGGSGKKAIWIDGGIHAREWIAPAVVSYMINELATKKDEYANLLNIFDFYIVPVVNPDGYEYTKINRLWRKTRSDYGYEDEDCKGADPNRNFGYPWGGPGASDDPCSSIYRGPYAWSEKEVVAIRDYILSRDDWLSYVAVHSYSQLWMTPWGFTQDLPANYAELISIADVAVAALKVRYGTEYRTGSITNLLNAASGGSVDWTLTSPQNIKYSFALELRDKGETGFILPQDQIIPSCEETWDGMQAMLDALKDK